MSDPQTNNETDPLARDVQTLYGTGPARAAELRRLGVSTVGDLLEYFPRRYEHERAERPIAQLAPGAIQYARGEVIAVDYVPRYPRPRFEATIRDPTGQLNLIWFHGGYLRGEIRCGLVLRVRGKVQFRSGAPLMIQPRWQIIAPDAPPIGQDVLRPVYPASAALNSATIASIISRNLPSLLPAVEEWFDPQLLRQRDLLPRPEAFRAIHRPATWSEAVAARRRLVYDELMLMQIGLILSRRLRSGGRAAPRMVVDRLLDQRIRRRFPFVLTAAQERAVGEIVRDLRSGRPMSRLLQGDVGSGKTVVAVYAMLVCVANRMQAALLAPTEVLAEQHHMTLAGLLRESAVNMELFTSRTRRESRGENIRRLSSGQVHIAIGTQALLEEHIEFASLGLVVVDEQHRLGVRQRLELRSKGISPHYLVMTATPIPRTLALSYFADFDVSVLDELPPGRRPVITRWLTQSLADEAWEFVRREIARGRQAYIVVPQIEETGDEAAGVTAELKRLSSGPLAGARLAPLHGRMPADRRQSIMNDFREGRIDVLITTTVIEVGIDVPNATVMVIENADRFGLAQLHQLRGRVGRGSEQSHCLLIADASTEDALARLNAMTATCDGFQIAEMDLKLRGPGDFFGTRQHGLPQFKLADITRELELLRQAKEDAQAILADDPNLRKPVHAALRRAIERQFGTALVLAQVG